MEQLNYAILERIAEALERIAAVLEYQAADDPKRKKASDR